MGQIVLGKVAFTPKGKWQSNKMYERYDMVYEGACIYISQKDENKAALDDETAWVEYFNIRVTTDMITDEAITNEKLKDGLISWAKLDDNVKNIIASREEGGVALSNQLGNSEKIGITQKKLTEEITDIKGQVGSIADEEDLTVVKKAGLTKQVELKLKDKAYDPDVHSGMGRKYLRKNNVVVGGIPFMGIVENVNAAEGDEEEIIDEVFFDRVRERFVGAIVSLDPTTQAKSYSFLMQWEDYGTMAYSLYVPISSSRMYDLNGVPYKWSGSDLVVYDGADRGEKVKNVLTQAMLQDAGGHNLENTIFHIQYDYTLDGESIEVPTGSILLFEGGSISNGTLTGDFTVVKAIGTEVFHNVTIPGNVESIDKEVADLKAMDNDLSGRITEEANRAMGSETNLQQGIGALDSRLQQVEGLAELSVEGGQIGIASATDFTNRTTEGDLKIPTVGAILNGADDEPTAGSEKLVKSGGVRKKIFESKYYIANNAIDLAAYAWRNYGSSASSVFEASDESGLNGTWHLYKKSISSTVIRLRLDRLIDGRKYKIRFNASTNNHIIGNISGSISSNTGAISLNDIISGESVPLKDGIVELNVEKTSDWNYLYIHYGNEETLEYPFDFTISNFELKEIKDVIDGVEHSVSVNEQALSTEQKTQALKNLGIEGVDDEPTAGSDNLVLSGGVKKTTDDIQANSYGIPLAKLCLFDGWLNSSGVYTNGMHSVVPVTSGDSIEIRIGQTSLNFAFLKSHTSVDSEPDLCENTSVISLTTNNKVYTGTAPADAKYLLIDRIVVTVDRTDYISILSINGYNVVDGFYKEISKNRGEDMFPDAKYLPVMKSLKRTVVSREAAGSDKGAPDKTYQTLTLATIADIHGNTENMMNFLEYIAKFDDYIDDSIILGDIALNDWTSSAHKTWPSLEGYNSVLKVIGNHDIINYNDTGEQATEEQTYDFWMQGIDNWGVVYTAGKNYYYKDYVEANVRLVVVDCMHFNEDQQSWLEDVLYGANNANSALNLGRHVIIALHIPITASKMTPWECNFTSADWESVGLGSSGTPSILGYVDAFQQAGGIFVMYMYGHWHFDVLGVYTNDGANYPNQFFCTYMSGGGSGDTDAKWQDCVTVDDSPFKHHFTLTSIDTKLKRIRLYRVSSYFDRNLIHRESICISYDDNNRRIIAQY